MPIQSPKTHQNQTVFALFASSLKNQGAQKRTRKPLSLKSSSLSSSSSASLQRSIFVQSDDEERNTPVISKKISTRSSSKSHATVGVLGGASVITTLRFLEKLVYWSTKHGEGKDVSVSHEESIPFIVCSDPCFSYSNGGQDLDPLIIENLRKKRVFLEEGGAGCIVMPCHVSHIWYDEISDDCPFPFLNVAECVALELKEAKLKPIEAGSNVRIGVIATDAVLMGRFYQEKLNKQDFEVVLPDKASMERIVLPAINALKRKDMEGAQNLLRIAIQMLLVRAVNVVILACDELQSLLPTDDPLLKQCLDPIDVLARSTVRYAKSAKRLEDNS
ncbi:hypothetical protein V2J09_010308 [Rumex salicifolius]